MGVNKICIFNSFPDYSPMRVIANDRMQNRTSNPSPILLGFSRSQGSFIGLVIEINRQSVEIPFGFYELAFPALNSDQPVVVTDKNQKRVEFRVLFVSEKSKSIWMMHPKVLFLSTIKTTVLEEWPRMFQQIFGMVHASHLASTASSSTTELRDSFMNLVFPISQDHFQALIGHLAFSNVNLQRSQVALSPFDQFNFKSEEISEIDLSQYSFPTPLTREQDKMQIRFLPDYKRYGAEMIENLGTSHFKTFWQSYENIFRDPPINLSTEQAIIAEIVLKKMHITPNAHLISYVEISPTIVVVKSAKISSSQQETDQSPHYILLFFNPTADSPQWWGPISLGLIFFVHHFPLQFFSVDVDTLIFSEIPALQLMDRMHSQLSAKISGIQILLYIMYRFCQKYPIQPRFYYKNLLNAQDLTGFVQEVESGSYTFDLQTKTLTEANSDASQEADSWNQNSDNDEL